MPDPARILFLLNPGKQSRNYILGLVKAARALGVEHLTIELAPIWLHIQKAGSGRDSAIRAVHAELSSVLKQHRISHVLGYTQTGIGDIGVIARDAGPAESIFTANGIRHILLWTDHPNWLLDGCALDEPQRTLLGHPLHTHILKSQAAADEVSEVLAWPNLHAMPMGEDYEVLQPASGIQPIHDVVAIVGGIEPIPQQLAPFLDSLDPDPAAMDRALLEPALAAFMQIVSNQGADGGVSGACRALAADWLDRKIARPLDSFWRISASLREHHAAALDWLIASPRRWYAAIATLRTMVAWRRNFTMAWLARRADVGIYGAPTAPLGFTQPTGADAWVPYERQSDIYARGHVALNTNAAWDEEGLTHKPFQIAAAAIPCLHHDVRGLSDAFESGQEVIPFSRPKDLLNAIKELRESPDRRAAMGNAMRQRALRDHTWEDRLVRMLRFAHEDSERQPSLSAQTA